MKKDWERLGEEICRSVQSAIDSQDFSQLNQTVSDTINMTRDQIEEAIRNVTSSVNQSAYTKASKTPKESKSLKPATAPKNNAYPVLYRKTAGTKVGAIVATSLGGVLGGSMSIGLIISLIFILVAGATLQKALLMTIPFGVFAVIGGCMTGIGAKMLGRLKRFQIYREKLGEREYCDVSDLALPVKKSQKFVLKDLKRMIKTGWFKQGHLDSDGKCLMVSDAAFDQYNQLMQHMEEQKREEERRRIENEKYSPQIQEILKSGEMYLNEIRDCNDEIPGEEISAKISRIEMLVDRIFARVKADPDSASDIRRMMEYYLPTTVKLLRAYEEMDRQPVQGENIISSKREIESTLDTLNVAFENLLDSLFEETAWDVSSDISVLNTMLAQEGLMEKDFK